jgi:hypothetical protein
MHPLPSDSEKIDMTTKAWFGRPFRRATAHITALFVLATTAASAAPGDLATKFRVNDEDPLKGLPTQEEANQNPLEFGYLVQDLVARGEGAFQKKEWERAAKYYRALATVVPDRAISYRKLCSAEVELGNVDGAAMSCGEVLSRGGARVWDHFRYLELMLKKAALSPAELSDLEASITHLRAHAAANPAPEKPTPVTEPAPAPSASSPERTKEQIKQDFLERRGQRELDEAEKKAPDETRPPANLALEIELIACRLSVRLRDEKKLGSCVEGLKKLGADPKLVLSFEWARTLVKKDARHADELLARAKTLGVPAPALAAMNEEQRRAFAGAGVLGFLLRPGLVVVLVGLAASIVLGALRFSRRLKRDDVTGPPRSLPH